MSHLKTLVMMQLKDKIDLSFVRSRRKLLFKIVFVVLQFALALAAFYAFFYVAVLLKIFSFSGYVPAELVTALFTLMLTLSVFGCTVGLTRTLYMAADNRVLLTFPVPSNTVFLSKFVLYYIFEIKKNLTFTMPMFLAYGMVSGAVWYYYPWVVVCFVFISLLPVALGAVLSIPALFIAAFVGHYKWLQAIFAAIAATAVVFAILFVINLIPANINFAGQWGTIATEVQKFLNKFAAAVYPFHCLNLMVVGGTAAIKSSLFNLNTLLYFGVLLAVTAALISFAFFIARPLFFRMAAKQFEFEKMVVPPKKNKVRKKFAGILSEDLKRNFRSSRYILRTFVSLVILPIAVFFLNKTYAAMNTRLTGQYMTVAFNLLVILLILMSDNSAYASVYSRDGNARDVQKTRPVNPAAGMFVKLIPRTAVIILSVAAAAALWAGVAGLSAADAVLLALMCIFTATAHLFWSAEMDLMKPQSDMYATVGVDYDNANERNSTILAFLLSAAFAFVLYFILQEGQTVAVVKLTCIAALFLAARTWLFVTRIRLYYAEK